MARCRAIPPRARSSATSRSSARCRRASPRASSSAITSASARSAAGRASRPPICRRPWRSPTPPSRRPAAASTGSTFRCCPTSRKSFFAPLQELQAARRARLSRRRPSHGRLQAAHRAGAQISAGVRARGLLRLRPHPAGRDAGGARTSIFRRSRPPARRTHQDGALILRRAADRHARHFGPGRIEDTDRSPRRRRVEAHRRSAWRGCARHGRRRRPLPCHPGGPGPPPTMWKKNRMSCGCVMSGYPADHRRLSGKRLSCFSSSAARAKYRSRSRASSAACRSLIACDFHAQHRLLPPIASVVHHGCHPPVSLSRPG